MEKSKSKKSNAKKTIVYLAAVVAFVTGIGLLIAGFIVPPTGIISSSVLTATGELLTFFGSIFGIGEYTKIQLYKIKNDADKNDDMLED